MAMVAMMLETRTKPATVIFSVMGCDLANWLCKGGYQGDVVHAFLRWGKPVLDAQLQRAPGTADSRR